MANQEHLEILKQGVEAWNAWRVQHYNLIADLDRIDLSGTNLSGVNFLNTNLDWSNLRTSDLRNADLSYTGLIRTNLQEANLSEANLSSSTMAGAFLEKATLKNTILRRANLSKADLSEADLSGADLSEANLFEANLSWTRLDRANLTGARLARAILDSTSFTGADLTHCFVYGVSAWNVQLIGATQLDLIITLPNEPTITVDNLEVAQFVYLLLNNPKIRDIIDTVAKKAVLILGRFTSERKAVLDALREALRTQGYLPILFDFDKPSSQDLTETVSTLAHLSRFIIVDLTDPSSAPYEVGTIASNHIKPIQAIFHPSDEAKRVFAMFPDLIMRYHWVLPPYEYQDQKQLLASLQERVIAPAERKAEELARLRTQEFLK